MKKNTHIFLLLLSILAIILLLIFTFAHKAENGNAVVKQTGTQKQDAKGAQEQEAYYGCGIEEEGHCPHCDQGIKDAACICGGHSFMEKGEALKSCPICKKPLKKIVSQDSTKELKTAKAAPKVLYYRNPMSPEITSPTPMKDTMGMDYIPVYEEVQAPTREVAQEGQAVSRVHLTKDQAVLSGVVSEPISKLKLSKEIRTVGRIAFDPELAVAQEEFVTALETRQKVSMSPDPDVISRAQDLVDKSKIRLRLLGMGDEEIAQLEKDKTAQIGLVLPEDKAWVYADVYEYDLGWVKQGQAAEVAVTAYPGEVFGGAIKSISPVLDPKTRTAKVRLEIDNPQRKLKPEMYVDVVIKAVYKDQSGGEDVLAVPRDAVLDTGLRKIVYVDIGDGTFLGREIKTGPEASASVNGQKFTFYPVLSGLEGNEKVVTKGNFLIDSQSQLTGGMSVLWGGAQEIKAGEQAASQGAAPVATQHQH
jgi:multidrug efflux pump subunit AcrA (membrane-fusion protein)